MTTRGVEDGLYHLNLDDNRTPDINFIARVPIQVWHDRLGHINERMMKDVVKDFSLPMSNKHLIKCSSCIIRKCHHTSYPSRNNENKSLLTLDLIFADVWGLAPMEYVSSTRYYVLFVDGASKYNWIFPVGRKSEVHDVFINFKTNIETMTGCKI